MCVCVCVLSLMLCRSLLVVALALVFMVHSLFSAFLERLCLLALVLPPFFVALRLQLLEPEKYPFLFKCLYGLLMLLPQSIAYKKLKVCFVIEYDVRRKPDSPLTKTLTHAHSHSTHTYTRTQLSHTHTHTHTRIIHTHTHTHTSTHIYSHPHTYTLIHTPAPTLTPSHALAVSVVPLEQREHAGCLTADPQGVRIQSGDRSVR
jgi:Vacuolar protein 14 C-terminal Fig4p binding